MSTRIAVASASDESVCELACVADERERHLAMCRRRFLVLRERAEIRRRANLPIDELLRTHPEQADSLRLMTINHTLRGRRLAW